MHLRSVELINWRSYRHAQFEFPSPDPDDSKNVVLVIGPNEYGKTSFFEAIALGLFGRSGLQLVPRVSTGTNNDAGARTNYSNFLEGTLHKRAIETGSPQCVVKLEWEDESGARIEIKRTWHFRANGTHKTGEDELHIYEGPSGVLAPPFTAPDQNLWYTNWIAQRFLHPSLAEFFLFDGEQVQRYANRKMNDQVRRGIDGLLGFPVLRSLRESLGKYAQNKRTKMANPSDDTVNAVKLAIEELENRLDAKKQERDKAIAELQDIEGEIEDLAQELHGRREDSPRALANSLLEDESRHRDEAKRAISNLTTLIAGDMALAIAGTPLRKETISRLESEAKRETWETGWNEVNRNLERFVSDLSARIGQLQPPISDNCHEAVIQAAKAAWQALWHPPPEGCADGYLHMALTGTTRAGTIDRLTAIDQHSTTEAANYVAQFENATATAEAKKRERLELERVAPEVESQTKRHKKLIEQSGRYKEQHDAAQREIDSATTELEQKRKELKQYISKRDLSAPALRQAETADAYASLVDELLRDAVPFQVEEVANEMTRAWKEMTHMSDRVDRIEISPDCEVRMLAADGSDLRQIDKSAGASQVFTQALITAITKVSGRTFPFIVDTPLARLSREQRLGVLKTFTDRPAQVILLSTDEEVVDDKLDAIRDRIAASYELTVTQDRGVIVTKVAKLDLRNV